ncbi:hypothetical protein B0H10DRAFT_1949700 [Mycena sp. CBHHK59/15]|nr:hypothetical protein B0H10DRAFT_1949700 [Mycena sp. CBHHK59/15]
MLVKHGHPPSKFLPKRETLFKSHPDALVNNCATLAVLNLAIVFPFLTGILGLFALLPSALPKVISFLENPSVKFHAGTTEMIHKLRDWSMSEECKLGTLAYGYVFEDILAEHLGSMDLQKSIHYTVWNRRLRHTAELKARIYATTAPDVPGKEIPDWQRTISRVVAEMDKYTLEQLAGESEGDDWQDDDTFDAPYRLWSTQHGYGDRHRTLSQCWTDTNIYRFLNPIELRRLAPAPLHINAIKENSPENGGPDYSTTSVTERSVKILGFKPPG